VTSFLPEILNNVKLWLHSAWVRSIDHWCGDRRAILPLSHYWFCRSIAKWLERTWYRADRMIKMG